MEQSGATEKVARHLDNDNEKLPSTRAGARACGSKRYFTGKPCRHGHIAPRYVNNSGCSVCAYICGAEYRDENPEKTQESRDKWALANPEKDREAKRKYAKKFYDENPETALERGRNWRKENRDENNKRRREKRAANSEEERQKDRKWREENPEKIKATQKKSYIKTRKKPSAQVNAAMAAGIRISIHKGSKAGRKWEKLVGYTAADLMAHLEKHFNHGMSWENYGRGGWHIDHKIPKSAFNFQTPEDLDFQRCWALENLQPLWEIDNIIKGAKLEKPFQPSLALAVPTNDNITTDATNVA